MNDVVIIIFHEWCRRAFKRVWRLVVLMCSFQTQRFDSQVWVRYLLKRPLGCDVSFWINWKWPSRGLPRNEEVAYGLSIPQNTSRVQMQQEGTNGRVQRPFEEPPLISISMGSYSHGAGAKRNSCMSNLYICFLGFYISLLYYCYTILFRLIVWKHSILRLNDIFELYIS